MPSCQARAACRRCSWADPNVHGRAGPAVAAFCALPVVDPGRALLVRCRSARPPAASGAALVPSSGSDSESGSGGLRLPLSAVCRAGWRFAGLGRQPAPWTAGQPGQARARRAARAWATVTSWHRLGTAPGPSESAPTPSESIGCSSDSESELASDSQGDTNLSEGPFC